MNFAPERNFIRLVSKELTAAFFVPGLTEEDVFNSHPQLGAIAYRIPPISTIFNGIPEANFDHFQKMSFEVSIVT